MNNQAQKFIDNQQKEIYNDGQEDDEKLEAQAKNCLLYTSRCV